MTHKPPYIVDGLQYCRWDRGIFEQMRKGQVSAVHVTIAYWETFRETVANMGAWNRMFQQHSDLIFHGRTGDDIRRAAAENKTAIFFGFQHCSPMEEDIDLIQVLHDLGARFMQLSYNNQSLLATGCYEAEDPGVTRFGKQAIAEMNRVGLVVDMSHSAERSTLDAIEISTRPIAITHANPTFWEPALRNKSDEVLKALAESGGMLGLSLYPFHLKDKSNCTIESFCEMAARAADLMGADHLGIGSDLCQGHPDSVVEWMRNGRWTRDLDFGEGNKSQAGWPDPVDWFSSNEDFGNVTRGLLDMGFTTGDVDGIMGGNWLRFYDTSFGEL
jgi:membrane dipeptidase